MNETEQSSSNESIIKAAERLRKKKLSRTESETMNLIHELELRRVQLDMQKSRSVDNGNKGKSDIERFIAIYDHAPMGYFIIDPESRIISINLRGAEMLGRERQKLINENLKDFISNEFIQIFEDFLQKLPGSEMYSSCKLCIRKPGNTAPIILHVEGIKSFTDDNFLLTALDITDQELAKERLRNSEIRYHRLFDSALVGVMILDGLNGKILDANPFLINLLGYSYEELVGKYLWEIGIMISTGQSLNAITGLLENGYMHIDDFPVTTKDQKQLYIEVAGVIFASGDSKVIQLNFHDITGRKVVEEKLRESEIRLKELNATKDKFFSIIAHDLKNSFNSIIGLGHILSEKVQERDYEEIETFAEIIKASSWKAMNLLTNLLEWSRSQTGRIVFNPGRFAFIDIISDVCELVRESAAEKMISIEVNDPLNTIMFCDREMISTVLRNLISNSIKFTRKAGKITISSYSDESGSRITVSDTGTGMSAEIMDKLFRIDESFSTEGTEGEQGTGMGLLLCHDFVGRHGGSIWAESTPGLGSTFIFTLPAEGASLHNNS